MNVAWKKLIGMRPQRKFLIYSLQYFFLNGKRKTFFGFRIFVFNGSAVLKIFKSSSFRSSFPLPSIIFERLHELLIYVLYVFLHIIHLRVWDVCQGS